MAKTLRTAGDLQLSEEDLATPTEARLTQSIPLILGTSLPVLAVVIVAPVLPAMQNHFAATPMAPMLVPMSMTIPSFMIAIVAPTVGLILDLYGRRRILLGGVIAYACVGLAPLWLQSLQSIMISRALLGVIAGVVLVAVTTFLCDMFLGARRDRVQGLQAMVTNLAAMGFFALGGALGATNWRLPFLVMGLTVVLVPFLIRTVPAQRRVVVAQGGRVRFRQLPRMPWARLLRRCAITVFAAIVFNAPVVETTFLLQRFDVSSPSTIGMVASLTSVATVVGAVIFLELSTTAPRRLLVGGFSTAAAGFAVVALSAQASPAVGGAIVVAGLVTLCVGSGVLLPTVLTWTMRSVNDGQRGRGSGMWVASFYIGQFTCPLIVRAISRGTGGLFRTFGLLAGVCTAMVVAILVVSFVSRRSRHRSKHRAAVTADSLAWQPNTATRHLQCPRGTATVGISPAQWGAAQPATARTAAHTRSRSA